MSKKTKEEWFEHNKKKLEYFCSRGFSFYVIESDTGEVVSDDYLEPSQAVSYLEHPNRYECVLCLIEETMVIGIRCDKVVYSLLNLPTMAIYQPQTNTYIYYVKYDEATYNMLEKCKCIRISTTPQIPFDRATMPKVKMPNNKDYKLNTLNELNFNQVQKIIRYDKLLQENKGYNWQVNYGTKYRIPTQTLHLLSSPIFTLNEKKILEQVLLTITNSVFVLDTSRTDKSYRVTIKDFTNDLKLSRTNESKETLILNAFEKLNLYGFIDTFSVEAGMVIFNAENFCKKLKRQNIQREIGFYNNVPGTKQASIIASWLDYLYMICSFTRQDKQLQIALDTLLEKLGLTYLLEQSRLSKIAQLLTTLSNIGHKYGFLTQAITFNSKDVKDLIVNRKGLKQYMIIHNAIVHSKEMKK